MPVDLGSQRDPSGQRRYANWRRTPLLLLLAALLLLIGYGATVAPPINSDPPPTTSAPAHQPANDDLRLYANIAARMANGEKYYTAAVAEHRFNTYPLKPFFAVRLPTLATVTAWLSPPLMRFLAFVLLCATCVAWWQRLEGAFDDQGRRFIAVLLIINGSDALLRSKHLNLHEIWAAGFIALSAAIYRTTNPFPAIIAAGVALLIRETALPFLCLMAAAAVWERRWKELAGWTAAVTLFAVAMALHYTAMADVVTPDDHSSPGWVRTNGLVSYLMFTHQASALRALPLAAAAVVVPLALLGWSSWKSRLGTIITLFHLGYAVLFMIIGRPNNFYWGFLVTPTLLVGLAFLPATAKEFYHILRSNRRTQQ
ncbi:MAG: hypothetical protein HOO99_08250 [Hyphomicrobiaceae bacterium]|nr:hypothetical protein [Hyphomicrobiaceae bacterium]